MAVPAFSLICRANAAMLREFIEQSDTRQERWAQDSFVALT
jgi:hypothetical protein